MWRVRERELNLAGDAIIDRRDFLGLSALWACVCAFVLGTIGLLRLPKPGLLPEVSRTLKIGAPEDFPVGSSVTYESRNVVVSRDEEGFYAISTVCTHLGCVVNQLSSGFICPCHGSRFDQNGRVTQGPAPKALNWLEIAMLPI